MHAARINGLTDAEMRVEERRYAVRIDVVYARLKQAEAQSAAQLAHRRANTQIDPTAPTYGVR